MGQNGQQAEAQQLRCKTTPTTSSTSPHNNATTGAANDKGSSLHRSSIGSSNVPIASNADPRRQSSSSAISPGTVQPQSVEGILGLMPSCVADSHVPHMICKCQLLSIRAFSTTSSFSILSSSHLTQLHLIMHANYLPVHVHALATGASLPTIQARLFLAARTFPQFPIPAPSHPPLAWGRSDDGLHFFRVTSPQYYALTCQKPPRNRASCHWHCDANFGRLVLY